MGLIVVPVDFEEASRRALSVAKDLASALGDEVVVVHVYQQPMYTYPGVEPLVMPGLLLEVQQAAQRALDQLAAEEQVGAVLRQGDPTTEILAVVAELKPELVAMGTHGRKGVVHLLLGSVAEKVLRTSPVPVMTVRAP